VLRALVLHQQPGAVVEGGDVVGGVRPAMVPPSQHLILL
jgi:hypothetical protein